MSGMSTSQKLTIIRNWVWKFGFEGGTTRGEDNYIRGHIIYDLRVPLNNISMNSSTSWWETEDEVVVSAYKIVANMVFNYTKDLELK